MASAEVKAVDTDDLVGFVLPASSRWYFGFVDEWKDDGHLFVSFIGDRPSREADPQVLIPASSVTATWKQTSWDHTR